jgi:hypothetical protein
MKTKQPRFTLIQEYEQAPDWMMFSQETVAAIRDCSIATIERDRWIGIGVPFIKMGHLVRYRKSEIRTWLDQQVAVQSTAQSTRRRNEHHV